MENYLKPYTTRKCERCPGTNRIRATSIMTKKKGEGSVQNLAK